MSFLWVTGEGNGTSREKVVLGKCSRWVDQITQVASLHLQELCQKCWERWKPVCPCLISPRCLSWEKMLILLLMVAMEEMIAATGAFPGCQILGTNFSTQLCPCEFEQYIFTKKVQTHLCSVITFLEVQRSWQFYFGGGL